MHTHSSTTHIDVTPKARHPVIPIPHTPATAAKQVYVNLANTLNNLAVSLPSCCLVDTIAADRETMMSYTDNLCRLPCPALNWEARRK